MFPSVYAWFVTQFCNCCATDCDCGCVLDCRMKDHRERAGITS
jgi:hypothetical protein